MTAVTPHLPTYTEKPALQATSNHGLPSSLLPEIDHALPQENPYFLLSYAFLVFNSALPLFIRKMVMANVHFLSR